MDIFKQIFISVQFIHNYQKFNQLIQTNILSLHSIIPISPLIMFDNWLHYSYISKRKPGKFFPAFKFYAFIINYSISHIIYYRTKTYNKKTIDSQQKHLSSIAPSVFLNQIYNNNISSIHKKKLITETRLSVMPQ